MKRTESEKRLEPLLKLYVEKKLNGYCLKLPSLHIAGIPDRLCLIPNGKMVFVELKTTYEKPKKIQLVWHRRLRKLGFRVEVIETTDQINDLIREYE